MNNFENKHEILEKEIYESPKLEVIRFDNEDIITASGDEYHDRWELPIV